MTKEWADADDQDEPTPQGTSVSTGDTSNVTAWVVVMLGAAAALAGALTVRRRRR